PATIIPFNEYAELHEFGPFRWVPVILNFLGYGICVILFRHVCLSMADRLLGRLNGYDFRENAARRTSPSPAPEPLYSWLMFRNLCGLRFLSIGFATLVAGLSLMASARSAVALEVRQTEWGFDGQIVPQRFNLFSVLVDNTAANPFEGKIELRKMAYGKQV